MFLWNSSLFSALFILTITFDRFYSIIRPHKAVSFNTVKRAKITVVCIVIFNTLFNFPYLFAMTHQGRQCMNDRRGSVKSFYHWLCYVAQFVVPFFCLITMNSVIIHTLRKRSRQQLGVGNQGQNSKAKTSEKQIYAILLLVAFSFVIFITPMCLLNDIFAMFMDLTSTPRDFAQFYLSESIVHKLHFTNNGINFFLYVISGRKFRSDLVNLLKCRNNNKSTALSLNAFLSSVITQD